MRIPYIINQSTRTTFDPSPETLSLVGEQNRKFAADNYTWDKRILPTLEDLCVQSIAKNFKEKTLFNELPCSDKVYLLELLPIDLPLELIIPLIYDEHYWKRRFIETFGVPRRQPRKIIPWKNLYLERNVQKLIQDAQPQYNDEETFDEILSLCDPYVTRIFVEELQPWKPPLTMEKEDIPEEWPIDHINMLPIFKKLHNITEFDLTYGVKCAGEDFKWDMFKISIADCQRLGKALLELKNLKILRIHRSNLEYKHCQALLQGLIKHKSIEELDLSNCEIGDAGALCVAYLLKEGSSLNILNLANNRIGKIGCEGIGFAMLSGNCNSLSTLILRLNPLGTEGAMGIMRAMVRCNIIRKLSLAFCQFEEDTPLKICQMIKLNETLVNLDISGNWFGEEGGKELLDSTFFNTSLEWLDMRETDISKEQEEKINRFLERNRNIASLDKGVKDELAINETEVSTFVYP